MHQRVRSNPEKREIASLETLMDQNHRKTRILLFLTIAKIGSFSSIAAIPRCWVAVFSLEQDSGGWEPHFGRRRPPVAPFSRRNAVKTDFFHYWGHFLTTVHENRPYFLSNQPISILTTVWAMGLHTWTSQSVRTSGSLNFKIAVCRRGSTIFRTTGLISRRSRRAKATF